MPIGYSLPLPYLLPLPHEEEQGQPSKEIDTSKHPPRPPISLFLAKRKGIEADRECKNLPTEIDHSGHFGSLGFVAIRAVGVCQRCARLHADAGYRHPDSETDPWGAVLHTDTVDDEANG